MNEKIWRGLGVSAGRAAGPIWYLKEFQADAARETPTDRSVEEELARLQQAITRTERNLTSLEEQVKAEQGEEVAQIFAAHKLLLSDPSFIGEAQQRLQKGQLSAEQALREVAEEAMQMLRSLEDPYFQERAVDVQDVLVQLLRNLQDTQEKVSDLFPKTGNYVVLADELTPAQTIALPKERVLGFIVRQGGKTSHTAILARTYGIPALVGVAEGWEDLRVQKWIELDGEEGWVRLSAEGHITSADNGLWEEDISSQSGSLQGMILAANIGSPGDLPLVQKFKAQGIGLYRTEFLFMGENLPSEEEQVEAYRQVIASCAPQLTVIRTLDIGGDKKAPALQLPQEKNPFLGVRALRLTLRRPELFRQQLRAIWRAAASGPTAIMFPMIATLEELAQAKENLWAARDEVLQDGHPVGELQIGMMIEIPSAAWLADKFAAKVDFFSIGTNDLTQYMLAVDRENTELAELYQPYHPAVLGMIARVSQAALRSGIWTGVCGEAGGEALLAPFFSAVGIKELSMAPGSLAKVRTTLAKLELSLAEREKLVESVLACASTAEVQEVLQSFYPLS
ncbi:phosphoenolpyruvate--protein phosphotransferase [Desulfosporosinus sp. BICA1-9]|uniref:phosphoenolpyruvate--protein phosphotransferase n=1 Tax=Desulfosporosinus sp. BICA1-9 TaxID=1531958 RepID=UPI00054C3283|nr:phosphoenolpyruvate--protein phosphotransferase [Desulfosporosinus sp. BICA1-9]KJS50620.1 MAG: phosphoenolpyruvate-protein phosphotransferase [Peptococcaceae bacterium BRH_c23]KJS82323.1 MAG: phosphoenolpyruvate-protein phosphotransferase [Desulfosporosinus sp. BICA1-9]HBW37400.1 phosphoenolpyruvate--protein phosphotransferase [Desulfosporosinus sp.]